MLYIWALCSTQHEKLWEKKLIGNINGIRVSRISGTSMKDSWSAKSA